MPISFEQEVKQHLDKTKSDYTNNCNSHKLLDFTLQKFMNEKAFCLDVKEKRQKINTSNWPSVAADAEQHKFIVDDLAVRKTLAYSPYSGILVRDNLYSKYYWFSVIDLSLMPKIRINRPIEKNSLQYKGKWIIDFRNAKGSNSLENIMETIKDYANTVIDICTDLLPCYGEYVNENIGIEGEIRKPGHWDIDVKQTR